MTHQTEEDDPRVNAVMAALEALGRAKALGDVMEKVGEIGTGGFPADFTGWLCTETLKAVCDYRIKSAKIDEIVQSGDAS